MYQGDLSEIQSEVVMDGNLEYMIRMVVDEAVLNGTVLQGKDTVIEARVGYCPMQPGQKMMMVSPMQIGGMDIEPPKSPYRYPVDKDDAEYPLEEMKSDFEQAVRHMLGVLHA